MLQSIGVALAVGEQFIHLADRSDFRGHLWYRTETINGLYKAEVIHRQPWKNREAVELATRIWVDGSNHRRLFAPIGNILPTEAEEVYRSGSEPFIN